MSIIRTLFQILLFKAKPSDVPFNINLTTIAFALAWLSTMLASSIHPNIPNPLIFTLLQIATLGAMIYLFLIINKKQARIHQTLLATFGAIALLNLGLLIAFSIGLGVLVFVFSIWSFVVQAYILKHSLDTGFPQAFFMTIAIQLSILFLISLFFPEFLQEYSNAIQQANA